MNQYILEVGEDCLTYIIKSESTKLDIITAFEKGVGKLGIDIQLVFDNSDELTWDMYCKFKEFGFQSEYLDNMFELMNGSDFNISEDDYVDMYMFTVSLGGAKIELDSTIQRINIGGYGISEHY